MKIEADGRQMRTQLLLGMCQKLFRFSCDLTKFAVLVDRSLEYVKFLLNQLRLLFVRAEIPNSLAATQAKPKLEDPMVRTSLLTTNKTLFR